MYFASRVQAGRMLASQLAEKYRYENCAVVALDDGGVVVGAQIAAELHCVMMMLSSASITLPREIEAIGAIAQDGSFTYNQNLSESEITEMVSEYRGFMEQEKFQKLSDLHKLVGAGGGMRKDLLAGHNIILVSDGLKDSFKLNVAFQYLKPVKVDRTIVATPLAGIKAVDYIHIWADEIRCLSVVENWLDTDHYYDAQDVPGHDKILEVIDTIVLNWK